MAYTWFENTTRNPISSIQISIEFCNTGKPNGKNDCLVNEVRIDSTARSTDVDGGAKEHGG